MNSWSWLHVERVHLLWPVAFVTIFLAYREITASRALAGFVSTAMQARLATRVGKARRVVRWCLVFGALAFGVLALMRPQSRGQSVQVRARRVSADVVVALDVSRSMLAEDAAPNRLTRAKSEISRMLEELAGHRVALVPFAGRATIVSPLTPDYGFFRMMLRGTSPTSVSRGGTAIGEAIRTGLTAFAEEGGAASRLLLLITDGEDHDSYPIEAAKAAAEAGVKVVAIGLGSEEGSKIEITDPRTGVRSAVTDSEGKPVITRVDGDLLREIAEVTKGVYIPAKVSALDLQAIVDEHIDPMVEEAYVESSRAIPEERYPIMVFSSLICLMLSALVGTRPLGPPLALKGNSP